MIIVKNPDGTYLLTPTAAEAAILDRIIAKLGASVVKDHFEGIVREFGKHLRETRQADLRQAYENAASTSQAEVRSILGLSTGL